MPHILVFIGLKYRYISCDFRILQVLQFCLENDACYYKFYALVPINIYVLAVTMIVYANLHFLLKHIFLANVLYCELQQRTICDVKFFVQHVNHQMAMQVLTSNYSFQKKFHKTLLYLFSTCWCVQLFVFTYSQNDVIKTSLICLSHPKQQWVGLYDLSFLMQEFVDM